MANEDEVETVPVKVVRNRSLARPFGWIAAWAVLARVFFGGAFPAQVIKWVEPDAGMLWVVTERFSEVGGFAPFKAPVLWGLVALVVLILAIRKFDRGQQTERTVELHEDGVHVGGRVIAFDEISSAAPVHADTMALGLERNTMALRLKSGSTVEIDMENAASFADMIEERRRATATVPLGKAYNKFTWGRAGWWAWALTGMGLVSGWAGDAGRAFATGNASTLAVAMLLAVIWTVVGWASSNRAAATIGNDGVRINGFGRARFIPFARIDAVRADDGVLRLVLVDGTKVSLGTQNQRELRSRIHAALENSRTKRSKLSEAHATQLERGDRSAQAWRAELDKMLNAQEYRTEPMRIADLEDLVEDGHAHPERRVAAALALPKDEATRARIQIAAAQCADEDTRAAIEAAANDELADAELESAARRFE